MSLRSLDGWTPKQTSRVTEWTEQGWPAAWETTTETQWNRRERSLMIALTEWEAGLCRRCGHHLADTTDPDTDPDNRAGSRAWVAEETECFACKAVYRDEQRCAPKENGDGGMPRDVAAALIHSAYLVDRPGRATPLSTLLGAFIEPA